MTISLELWELGNPMPGMTASHGASLGEAAAVCLASQQHETGVSLRLEPSPLTSATLHWRTLPPDAVRCHTGDRATEDGACGVAILLVQALTGQVVLFRSERKEGCDYWLGPPDFPRETGLKGMSRIEVSGIRRGDASNFRTRHASKRKQVSILDHPSDKYVSIVEFSTPMALLEKL
jgi:hypothetical protein